MASCHLGYVLHACNTCYTYTFQAGQGQARTLSYFVFFTSSLGILDVNLKTKLTWQPINWPWSICRLSLFNIKELINLSALLSFRRDNIKRINKTTKNYWLITLCYYSRGKRAGRCDGLDFCKQQYIYIYIYILDKMPELVSLPSRTWDLV